MVEGMGVGGGKNRGWGSEEEALTLSPSSSLTLPPRQHCGFPRRTGRTTEFQSKTEYINNKKRKILRWRRREDDASASSQGKPAPSVIRLVTAAISAAPALPGASRRFFPCRGRSYISEQRSPPTSGMHPSP